MLEATKANNKLAGEVQKVNLLEGLEIRKVGTNSIEKAAKLVTEDQQRDGNVVVSLVKIAVLRARKRALAAQNIF